MKLLNAVWYTTKDFPKWIKNEFVKNYKMTKEQRLKIKLDYEKGLAEWEAEMETIMMKDSGDREADNNEPPF